MRYLLKALLVVVPACPDASDAGAGRRQAGSGREGGISLADLQQRLHHDAAGLYAARQGLEFPRPLERPDQHPGRGRRQRRARSSARREKIPAKAGTRGSVSFTALSKKDHSSTARPTPPTARSTISSSRCSSRVPATSRRRRAMFRATGRCSTTSGCAAGGSSSRRARPPGRSRRPRQGCVSSSMATSSSEIIKGEMDRPSGAAAGRFLLAGARRDARDPQQRDDSDQAGRVRAEVTRRRFKPALQGCAQSSCAPWLPSPR